MSCTGNIYRRIEEPKVFLDEGYSGRTIYIERNILYSIDSLVTKNTDSRIIGFDMVVSLSGGDSRIFKSHSNRLDGFMRAALIDNPDIESVVFTSFVFDGERNPANRRIGLYVKGQ